VSEHRVAVAWRRATPDFAFETYDRTHEVRFPGGQALRGSAAPDYKGDAAQANPEELLAAALASCHMLTFLAVAARSRLVIDGYEDEPVATLEKGADGRVAVTRIALRPKVVFGGEPPPPERLKELHDRAHRACFIAASVRCEVTIEPR
jgi:organic hydroperoxide reductase OsmC/OhrA